MSDENIDVNDNKGSGVVVQNIVLAKPSKGDSPQIVRGEPLKNEAHFLHDFKVKAGKEGQGYTVQECKDDDDSSNKEYEL